MISEETISFDEIMVSFDVKSLFTNVPLPEALDVIKDKLVKDENLDDRITLNAEQITHLLKVCLRTTYFVFNKEYYEQQNGAAMGFTSVTNSSKPIYGTF